MNCPFCGRPAADHPKSKWDFFGVDAYECEAATGRTGVCFEPPRERPRGATASTPALQAEDVGSTPAGGASPPSDVQPPEPDLDPPPRPVAQPAERPALNRKAVRSNRTGPAMPPPPEEVAYSVRLPCTPEHPARTFGVVVRRGDVSVAARVAQWMIGLPWERCARWVRERGGTYGEVSLTPDEAPAELQDEAQLDLPLG